MRALMIAAAGAAMLGGVALAQASQVGIDAASGAGASAAPSSAVGERSDTRGGEPGSIHADAGCTEAGAGGRTSPATGARATTRDDGMAVACGVVAARSGDHDRHGSDDREVLAKADGRSNAHARHDDAKGDTDGDDD